MDSQDFLQIDLKFARAEGETPDSCLKSTKPGILVCFHAKSGQPIRRLERRRPLAVCWSRRIWHAIWSLVLLVFMVDSHGQQSLDQTITEQLRTQDNAPCATLRRDDTDRVPSGFGPQLSEICALGDQTAAGSSFTGGGAIPIQTLPLIQARMAKDGKSDFASLGNRSVKVAALGNSSTVTGPISSQRFQWFIGTEYGQLNKDKTNFADAYDSQNWNAVGGADYRFSEGSILGVALSFNQWTGDFLSRGDFQVRSTSVIGYGSISLWTRLRLDAQFSYGRSEHERTRFAQFSRGPAGVVTSGLVSADYDTRDLATALSAAYEFGSDDFKIEPRVGLAFSESAYESYQETGKFEAGTGNPDSLTGRPSSFGPNTPTGLELAADRDRITSLQSVAGLTLKWTLRPKGIRLSPYTSLSWHHEFKNDAPNVNVRFRQDNRANPQRFSYSNETPDRDFMFFGAGVTVAIGKRVEPYVAVRVLLGHKYFDSAAVSLGVRVDLD